jgi:ketopantoate reductase
MGCLEIHFDSMYETDMTIYQQTLADQGEKLFLIGSEQLCKTTSTMVVSMLQSLRAGQLCEVDAMNDYLQKKTDETSVNTPVNKPVIEIIKGIQEGRHPFGADNLNRIRLFPNKEILNG